MMDVLAGMHSHMNVNAVVYAVCMYGLSKERGPPSIVYPVMLLTIFQLFKVYCLEALKCSLCKQTITIIPRLLLTAVTTKCCLKIKAKLILQKEQCIQGDKTVNVLLIRPSSVFLHQN